MGHFKKKGLMFLQTVKLPRDKISWIVVSHACPRWSFPVTLGGGMTMQYGFLLKSPAVK